MQRDPSMVLQGGGEGFSTPFDAPLYGGSIGRTTPAVENEFDFRDCEAVIAYFSIENDDVADVLPEGVEPFGSPPHGVAWLSRYPFSSVGEYTEYLSLIQVEDLNGEMAYYVPYVYATTDAGMASGREVVGAPTKRAEIELDASGSVIHGTLERPAGNRLLSMSLRPERQVTNNPLLEVAMPDPVALLSLRHVPPIEGGDGVTQLIEWYARITFHEDARGNQQVWIGPSSMEYDASSRLDPIDKVGIDDVDLAMYVTFDMAVGVDGVQREWVV